jgi:hypothetical protein
MAILAAAARDILALAELALLVASWTLAGLACLPRAIARDEPLLVWSTAFALGAGGSAIGFTLLGAFHLLGRGTVLALALGGCALAAVGARQVMTGAVPRLRLPPASSWPQRLALIALLGTLALSLFATLAPPSSMDAAVYHLRVPQQFLRDGRWSWLETLNSAYPMYVEMLFGEGLALGGGVLAALIHWALGLGALAAAGAWARRLGGGALWAAVALGGSALFVWEATSAFIDLGMALFSSLAMLWASRPDRGRAATVLAGLFAGLAAGSKLTGAAIAALAGAIAFLSVWPDRARGALRMVVVGALALLVALPWYVRSALATGNPFYPVGSRHVAAAVDVVMSYGYGRDLLHLLSSPFDLLARGDVFDQGWSVGPAYLALAPLGFAAARRWQPAAPERARAALVAAVAVSGWWVLWFYISPQARLLLPVLPIAAALAGAGAAAALRAPLRPLRLVALGALAVTAAGGLGTAGLTAAISARVVLGLEPPARFLERHSWNYVAYEQADQLLPLDARVAVEGGPNLYYMPRPAVWVQDVPAPSPRALRERGFSHHLRIQPCPAPPSLPGETTLWEGRYPLRLSRLRGGVRVEVCARLTALPP